MKNNTTNNGRLQVKNKLGEDRAFKISRFKEYIKKTVPHKHDNYHEFIFLHEGKGFHTIEENRYVVAAPDFYYLQPGQLHFWQFTAIPKGYVILFSPSFFNAVDDIHIKNLLLNLAVYRRIQLTPEEYPHRILEELFYTYRKEEEYSEVILKGQLYSLVGRMLSSINLNKNREKQISSKYEQFQSLLGRHASEIRKVKDYAGLMNVTPQYLNKLCKKNDGRPAAEIINEQVILEIKRYLLHTDLTMQEIADLMNFADNSNFVKFFKAIEGCTPVQFRKNTLNTTT